MSERKNSTAAPERIPPSSTPTRSLLLWALAGAVGGACSGGLVALISKSAHDDLFGGPIRATLRGAAIGIVVGFIVCQIVADIRQRTRVILLPVLGGAAGAVGGVLVVVILGMLAWEMVRGTTGLAIAAAAGTAIGVAVSAAVNKGGDPRLWLIGGLGGFIGAGIGAFGTIASAETLEGMDWALYGGIYGALIGALVGAFNAALLASAFRAHLTLIRLGRRGHRTGSLRR